MNRLYVVESMPTGTGAIADHRLPMRSCDVEAFARTLAGHLDERFTPLAQGVSPLTPPGWLDALARDLRQHRRTSVVLAGPGQPPFVHTLAHAVNDFLGNVGHTVFYTAPATVEVSGGSLRDLMDEMDAGAVDILVILGGNLAFTTPIDLRFAERIERVPFRAHLGLYDDETSALCHWHLPEAHFLEAWGDVRSHDGTVSITQPLIAPLHGGKTAPEVLAVLLDQPERTGHDLVRSHWRSVLPGDFESWWRQTVHDGLATGTQSPARTVTLRANWSRWAGPTARRRRSGNQLSARSDDLRWPFRQQRLAARTAQTALEVDLGQRRLSQSRDGNSPRFRSGRLSGAGQREGCDVDISRLHA